jgi:hypothetical protein
MIPDRQVTFPIIPDFSRCIRIGQEFLPGVFGEAFPAGAVMPLVLRCHAHALLLTIAKVNIVTTSLEVTLRKLVMTQVFCGTRLQQSPIGDDGVIEQQGSAGAQPHG